MHNNKQLKFQRLTADVHEESKKAVRLNNHAKGRYGKNLNAQILAIYGKPINPTEKLTKKFKK